MYERLYLHYVIKPTLWNWEVGIVILIMIIIMSFCKRKVRYTGIKYFL